MGSVIRVWAVDHRGKHRMYQADLVEREAFWNVGDQGGKIECVMVVLDPDDGGELMTALVWRDGQRMRFQAIEAGDVGGRQSVAFTLKDADFNPGTTFRFKVSRLHECNAKRLPDCEHCGRAVVDLEGERSHEEPPCDEWLADEALRVN